MSVGKANDATPLGNRSTLRVSNMKTCSTSLNSCFRSYAFSSETCATIAIAWTRSRRRLAVAHPAL